jgi:predicted MFS family arabinose efflux permease
VNAPGGNRSVWLSRSAYTLLILTLVYALNIADRFIFATLIEPIKAEFELSDGGVAFLTGSSLAIFYVAAGIPLGALADRTNRRNMIGLALAVWSLLTVVCGFATTYWQLLIGRIGVGIGEAGGTPPSQSLLADEFRSVDRGAAMSIFSIGSVIGAAAAIAGGGLLAEQYGWRHTLIVFGAIGIPLALLVRITLREPIRGALDGKSSASNTPRYGIVETLAYMYSHRSIFHLLIGGTVLTFAGGGLLWWAPAFLARSHGFSVGEAGGLVGAMMGIAGPFVMIGTGWAMARLAPRDLRWQLWFVSGASCIMALAGIVAFWSPSRPVVLGALWVFAPATFIYIGPTLALFQSLVPAAMRGQAVAIFLFTANVANLVIAPQLLGSMSDVIGPLIAQPKDSLRWVLVGGAFTGFWGVWHYMAAARTLAHEIGQQARLSTYWY